MIYSNILDKVTVIGRSIYQKIIMLPWVIMIFTVGILLRVSGFMQGTILYDEMFSLQMTHLGLWEMIKSLRINLSPPGFEIMLWFVTRIFGWNEFSLRVPSIIASILSLWVVYKISKVFQFTKKQIIGSLFILALLPFQLITAQQGRVYALFSLLYLLGIYFAISGYWLYFGIANFGLIWSHFVSLLFIPVLILIALLIHPKDWKKIALVSSLTGISFLPWLFPFISQAFKPIPWFRPLTIESFVLSGYFSLFGWGLPEVIQALILCFLVLCIILLISILCIKLINNKPKFNLFKHRKVLHSERWNYPDTRELLFSHNRINLILFILFIIPLSLMIIFSLLKQNIVIYRTLSLTVPPFILWIVHLFVVEKPYLFHKVIWYGTSCILVLGILFWSPTQVGGGMNELSAIVGKSFLSGDAFYHDTGLTALIFKYYFPTRPQFLIDGSNTLGLADLHATKLSVKEYPPELVPAHRLWVVWTRSNDLEIINKVADERVSRLVQNCPLISRLNYPESWDVEIYLCVMH